MSALSAAPAPGAARPRDALRLVSEPEPVNWGAVPRGPLWQSVSFRAKAILGTLGILAQGRTSFRTSLDEIREELGVGTEGSDELCSDSTIRRGLRELERAGAIEMADMGRNFSLLFRLKGRTSRPASIFDPPPRSDLHGSRSDLHGSRSDLTIPPDPPIGKKKETTTTGGPSSSSFLASEGEPGPAPTPPPPPPEAAELAARVRERWPETVNAEGRIAALIDEYPDTAAQAVVYTLLWAKALGLGLAHSTARRWKQWRYTADQVAADVESVRPRPKAVAAAPAAEPGPEPVDVSVTPDELVRQALDRNLPEIVRQAARRTLEAAVEAGEAGPEVLEGLEKRGRPGPGEKPAAGSATKLSPRPAALDVSPRDSSLNSRSEQVSLGAPPLRSALSGRDLTSCSPIRASPL